MLLVKMALDVDIRMYNELADNEFNKAERAENLTNDPANYHLMKALYYQNQAIIDLLVEGTENIRYFAEKDIAGEVAEGVVNGLKEYGSIDVHI